MDGEETAKAPMLSRSMVGPDKKTVKVKTTGTREEDAPHPHAVPIQTHRPIGQRKHAYKPPISQIQEVRKINSHGMAREGDIWGRFARSNAQE